MIMIMTHGYMIYSCGDEGACDVGSDVDHTMHMVVAAVLLLQMRVMQTFATCAWYKRKAHGNNIHTYQWREKRGEKA